MCQEQAPPTGSSLRGVKGQLLLLAHGQRDDVLLKMWPATSATENTYMQNRSFSSEKTTKKKQQPRKLGTIDS